MNELADTVSPDWSIKAYQRLSPGGVFYHYSSASCLSNEQCRPRWLNEQDTKLCDEFWKRSVEAEFLADTIVDDIYGQDNADVKLVRSTG